MCYLKSEVSYFEFKHMINIVSAILINNRKWEFCLALGTESKERLALLVAF